MLMLPMAAIYSLTDNYEYEYNYNYISDDCTSYCLPTRGDNLCGCHLQGTCHVALMMSNQHEENGGIM